MDETSINNLMHIKKILSLEFNKYLKDKDKNIAYHDYFINIINCIDLMRENIKIANDPIEHIKIKKRGNPDDKKIK